MRVEDRARYEAWDMCVCSLGLVSEGRQIRGIWTAPIVFRGSIRGKLFSPYDWLESIGRIEAAFKEAFNARDPNFLHAIREEVWISAPNLMV